MLSRLKIENFAIVEKAEIDFSTGLNVFTGETGAGKSMLLGALGVFLNRKTNSATIRDGRDLLSVEALFTYADRETVLRRDIGKKRSICYIDGSMVPFEKIREKAREMLNIYGQNEHVFLLNSLNHGVYLDRFSNSSELLEQIARSARQLKRVQQELEEMQNSRRDRNEKLDFLSFRITELEKLDLQPGEDELLEQQARIMGSAEEILSRSQRLTAVLYQEEDSLYNKIAHSREDIDFLIRMYPDFAASLREIEKFYDLLPDISSTLSNLTGGVEFDEQELNIIEQKLLDINSLKNKYATDLPGLIAKLAQLREQRQLLENMDISLQEKEKEVEQLFAEYSNLIEELRLVRKSRAAELGSYVEQELKKLEMSRAVFQVRIEENEIDPARVTAAGPDKVEFFFSSNPGQPAARIKDVASGGELSRLMLVLKSLLDENQHSTYIFDEIDTGIGGKTAEFVGDRLRSISRTNQVLCISHLPQIAAFADRHFLISKEFREDQTFSFTRELQGNEKVEELARLMAGSAVNDDVLRAAENLLNRNRP